MRGRIISPESRCPATMPPNACCRRLGGGTGPRTGEGQEPWLSLKVYDCYRPVRAVRAFVAWAKAPEDGRTKGYYPHLRKSQSVPKYIASQSQHSTGFAVDLTIVEASAPAGKAEGDDRDCTAPGAGDGSQSMGATFDCFDTKANTASPLATPSERKNRGLLLRILEGAGLEQLRCGMVALFVPRRRLAALRFRNRAAACALELIRF